MNGIIGLVVNPDFGTGSGTSAEQFVVDWNGWHAVDTLLLVPIAFVAAVKPRWAVGFLAYNAVVNAGVAVWALLTARRWASLTSRTSRRTSLCTSS